jgi:hypothetical protein
VSDDRWTRISDLLADASRGDRLGDRIVRVGNDLLGAPRSSLSLVVRGAASTISSTDPLAHDLVEQQFLIGEGPSFDASTADAPVVADDLAHATARVRWPTFAETALANGVHAAHAFPLRVGAARLGILTSFRPRAGALTSDEFADGLVLSSAATLLLLTEQAAQPTGAAAESFRPGLDAQGLVQRAAGMTSEQLGISIVDALSLIRGRAFATDTTVLDVAAQIVRRELSLEEGEST